MTGNTVEFLIKRGNFDFFDTVSGVKAILKSNSTLMPEQFGCMYIIFH